MKTYLRTNGLKIYKFLMLVMLIATLGILLRSPIQNSSWERNNLDQYFSDYYSDRGYEGQILTDKLQETRIRWEQTHK